MVTASFGRVHVTSTDMNDHSRDTTHFSDYDPRLEAYHTQHDWSGNDPLSQTVIRSIAALSGCNPESGPPLIQSIDPDALNRLFSQPRSDMQRNDHISFTHQDCRITIFREGDIILVPPSRNR